MNTIVLFQGHLRVMNIISGVKHSLIIDFDKDEDLLDLQQMFHVLKILLVDSSTEPNHENDGCYHKNNVVESIYIRNQ
jgi:hypothetical protein